MPAITDLWKIEEGFWLGGESHYREHMADDARMVFPGPTGVLAGPDILRGLANAPRWRSVDIERKGEIEARETRVLIYQASGLRDDDEPYVALCSSTYVQRQGEWRLIIHQQTPSR